MVPSNLSQSPVAKEVYRLENRGISDSIIKKQQKEMELLIQELKDRDKELNFMVRSHQQQLDIWAQDKSKVPMLEQRCANLEEMLSHKENDIQVLNANLSRRNGQATETAAEIKRLSRECQLEHARLKRSSLLLATADAKVARAGILEKSLQSLLHSKDKELTSMSKKLEEVQNLLDVRVQYNSNAETLCQWLLNKRKSPNQLRKELATESFNMVPSLSGSLQYNRRQVS